jgi:hypothetical protein
VSFWARFARTGFVPKIRLLLDHKVIGPQYALTNLGFLLIGFSHGWPASQPDSDT